MDLKELILKHIDAEGFVQDVLEQAVEPKLAAFVADTKNTIDDSVYNVAWPLIKSMILEAVKKVDPV